MAIKLSDLKKDDVIYEPCFELSETSLKKLRKVNIDESIITKLQNFNTKFTNEKDFLEFLKSKNKEFIDYIEKNRLIFTSNCDTKRKYIIDKKIEDGGMGWIYKAKTGDGTDIVLKILKSDLINNVSKIEKETVITYFKNEFEVCRKLKNVTSVVDVFSFFKNKQDEQDIYCITMEYIDGIRLDRLLSSELNIDSKQKINLLEKICTVLFEVHENSECHRDIDPTNIMILKYHDNLDIDTIEIKLIDFGLAKLTGGERFRELAKKTKYIHGGKKPYISPEMLKRIIDPDIIVDYRADIYAIGVMSFEILSGKLPEHDDLHLLKEMAYKINSDLHPITDNILSKAMAENSKDRYQNLKEFINELKAPYYGIPLKALLLESYDELKIKDCIAILEKICAGLKEYHNNKDFHGNINTDNIIVYYTKNKEYYVSIIPINDENLKENYYPYKSPEESKQDKKSDIYSVGVIAFELFTGQHPDLTEQKVEDKIVYKFKKYAHECDSRIYSEIDIVLEKAIAYRPEDRYSVVSDFIFDITEAYKKGTRQTLPSLMHTDNYWFVINEHTEDDNITFYFTIDADTKDPIKLGDGTYGVVFLVHNNKKEKYAIKIFYNNYHQNRLSETIISEFEKEFNKTDKTKDLFLINVENITSFTKKIKKLDLTTEQENFLINKIQKNAYKQFRYESDAVATIHEKLKSADTFSGIIRTEGGIINFRDSKAHELLNERFSRLGFHELSNYAIVMPFFQYNLKELLEEGSSQYMIRKSILKNVIGLNDMPYDLMKGFETAYELRRKIDDLELPFSRSKKLKDNIYEMVGYDILSQQGFKKRIKTMMPYLLSIVEGLNTLHRSELYHLDLKPANIFVKKEGNKIKVVLGDLGFLRPEEFKPTPYLSEIHSMLPLGSIHYRSPEQTEFYDISDVEVTIKKNEKGENEVILISRDPKFKDSIIEENDVVIFSKDNNHIPYEIENISGKDKIAIKIKVGKNINNFKEDKRTQVVLYKKQEFRTDLFGLGAIIFDMTTCGKSAERFYDNIRSYDNPRNSIENIMMSYKQVFSHQTNETGLIHVFEPFKNQATNEYAPHEIVRLVLKLMLYKTKNTFFRDKNGNLLYNNKSNYYKAIEAVYTEIKTIKDRYGVDDSENELYDRKVYQISKGSEDNVMSKIVSNIQKLTPLNFYEFSLRLAKGIWYIRELTLLVRGTFSDIQDSEKNFFAQMLPENIELTSAEEKDLLVFINPVYPKKIDYKEDLKRDLVFTRIRTDISDPYVPDTFLSMRRTIHLEKTSGKNTFIYKFMDSSIIGDYLFIEDWIVIQERLFKVILIDGNKVVLEDDIDINFELDIKPGGQKAVYYKNIDPCKYYLEILSSYIYNIFFVGIEEASISKPLIIRTIKDQAYMLKNWNIVKIKREDLLVSKKDDKEFKKANLQKKLHIIYIFITKIYLKLTFIETGRSYYDQNIDDVNRILSVYTELQELQKMVESFLDIKEGILDLSIKDIENVIDSKKRKLKRYSKEVKNYPSFDRTIKLLVDVNKKDEEKKLPIIFSGIKKFFSKDYNIDFIGETHTGLIRATNEDSYYYSNNLKYCIVADGMGGEAAGEVASKLFIQKSSEVLNETEISKEDITLKVKEAFEYSNKKILEHVKLNPECKGMGSTGDILFFYRDHFIIGHVGDSRIYRYREGHLNPLTKDHSVIQEKIDNGSINLQDAKKYQNNEITRAIGVNDTVEPDISQDKFKPNDLFLICSDGLTDMVKEDEIKDILSKNMTHKEKVEQLINKANSNGGEDNITVILAQVE